MPQTSFKLMSISMSFNVLLVSGAEILPPSIVDEVPFDEVVSISISISISTSFPYIATFRECVVELGHQNTVPSMYASVSKAVLIRKLQKLC